MCCRNQIASWHANRRRQKARNQNKHIRALSPAADGTPQEVLQYFDDEVRWEELLLCFFSLSSRTCSIFLTTTVSTFPSVAANSVVNTSPKAPWPSRFLTWRALQSNTFMLAILSAEDCAFFKNQGSLKFRKNDFLNAGLHVKVIM